MVTLNKSKINPAHMFLLTWEKAFAASDAHLSHNHEMLTPRKHTAQPDNSR